MFPLPKSRTAWGTIKAVNMVLLDALLELTHALPKETSFAVLNSKVRNAKLLEVDCRAIDAGMECIGTQLNAAGSSLHAREETLVPCK